MTCTSRARATLAVTARRRALTLIITAVNYSLGERVAVPISYKISVEYIQLRHVELVVSAQ